MMTRLESQKLVQAFSTLSWTQSYTTFLQTTFKNKLDRFNTFIIIVAMLLTN
jgi:hypothetical protein